MQGKIPMVISLLFGLGLLTVSLLFVLNTNNLKRQLSESRQMIQKIEEELKYFQSEKEKVVKANEKLYADAVSYVALNSKIQNEKADLQKRLQETQKIIEAKEAELQRVKQKIERLEKDLDEERIIQKENLFKEKNELEERIKSLEATLKKERGLYHYNLGVAYTQAGFYDEAVEAYEKSLTFKPDNSEAHYNLGLLYENVQFQPEKAAWHYHNYLEFKPDAEDKKEVRVWIERLK